MEAIWALDIWEGNSREEGGAKGSAFQWSYYLRRAFHPVPQGEKGIAHAPPPQESGWRQHQMQQQSIVFLLPNLQAVVEKGRSNRTKNSPNVLIKPQPCYQYHVPSQFTLDLKLPKCRFHCLVLSPPLTSGLHTNLE